MIRSIVLSISRLTLATKMSIVHTLSYNNRRAIYYSTTTVYSICAPYEETTQVIRCHESTTISMSSDEYQCIYHQKLCV